jgi:hypothetical protein
MASEDKTAFIVDAAGTLLAELIVSHAEGGWFTGKVVSQRFSSDVKRALDWYDEVVQDQMLSYLDEATAAVEQLGLRVQFPDGSAHKIYSLHVNKLNDVSFRTSPVPPPSWLVRGSF